MVHFAMKWKTNISIECKASDVAINFNHDHDLDFTRSDIQLAISQPKMVQLAQN